MSDRTPEANASFSDLGLSPAIVRALSDAGYEAPTPIQAATIPVLLRGRDVIGQAQTGTGKTAAFALPMLDRVDVSDGRVQGLVLVPTRELAIQVAEAIHTYGRHLGDLHVIPVYGGAPFSSQLRHLQRSVHIVVGTPGRIMDHLRRGSLDLGGIGMVVLDEADEMLRMGFAEDVDWILSQTPRERQTALFTATMPPRIRAIAQGHLRNPQAVSVTEKTMTVPQVEQRYLNVSESQKLDALTRILGAEEIEAVLVFARTKNGAAELTEKLVARGWAAEALHGDMSQAQREMLLKRFRGRLVEVVVATDVAARGLDVEHITHVINFDAPNDVESYVHRIGRTGRAGRKGIALLFVTPRQRGMMRDIERYTRQKLEPMRMPTRADVAARTVELFKQTVKRSLGEAENLDVYVSLVEELAEECGVDMAEVAAAIARVAMGAKPIEVSVEPEPDQAPQVERGMVRLFLSAGSLVGVRPSDVVGAIANEAGVPGREIGSIDIFERFTFVEIPAPYVERVLQRMARVQLRGRAVQIKVALPERPQEAQDRGARDGGGEAADRRPRTEPQRGAEAAPSKPWEREAAPRREAPAKRDRYEEIGRPRGTVGHTEAGETAGPGDSTGSRKAPPPRAYTERREAAALRKSQAHASAASPEAVAPSEVAVAPTEAVAPSEVAVVRSEAVAPSEAAAAPEVAAPREAAAAPEVAAPSEAAAAPEVAAPSEAASVPAAAAPAEAAAPSEVAAVSEVAGAREAAAPLMESAVAPEAAAPRDAIAAGAATAPRDAAQPKNAVAPRDKPAHRDKPARRETAGGTDNAAHRDKPARRETAGGSDKPARRETAGGSDRPARRETAGGSDRPARRETAGGSDKPARRETTGRRDEPARREPARRETTGRRVEPARGATANRWDDSAPGRRDEPARGATSNRWDDSAPGRQVEPARRESTGRRDEPARRESTSRRDEPARRESTGRRDEPARRDATSRRDEPARRESTSRRDEPARRDATSRSSEPARRESTSRRDEPARRDATSRSSEPARRDATGRRDEPARRDATGRRDEPARRESTSRRDEPARRDSAARGDSAAPRDTTRRSAPARPAKRAPAEGREGEQHPPTGWETPKRKSEKRPPREVRPESAAPPAEASRPPAEASKPPAEPPAEGDPAPRDKKPRWKKAGRPAR